MQHCAISQSRHGQHVRVGWYSVTRVCRNPTISSVHPLPIAVISNSKHTVAASAVHTRHQVHAGVTCPLLDTGEKQKYAILLGGALIMLMGLLSGFIPPEKVWYPMLIKSHSLAMMNGSLCVLLGLLQPDLSKVLNTGAMKMWGLTLFLGALFNPVAHLIGAFTGTKSEIIRSMVAPNGDSMIVTGCLYFCAVNILVATCLTCHGLYKQLTSS